MTCGLLLIAATAAALFGQNNEPAIPSLLESGNAAYLKGDYESALQSFSKAWELAQQMPPSDPIRYDILKRLTRIRSAAGEFADADYYLQLAINWRETTNGQ